MGGWLGGVGIDRHPWEVRAADGSWKSAISPNITSTVKKQLRGDLSDGSQKLLLLELGKNILIMKSTTGKHLRIFLM